MKLTLSNLKELKKNATPIMFSAIDYIIDSWRDSEDKTAIFTDVLNYGCAAGTVGFLVYTNDCVKFYLTHKQEIDMLLYNIMDSYGEYNPAKILRDWEVEDPFALGDNNRTLLAWFGFEETLRNVGLQFDDLEDML